MDEQDRVSAFVEAHDLHADPEYRLLDLASEVGELAEGANDSTGYGTDPRSLSVDEDELGDALFALLAFAESVDVDAGDALDAALAKYERRIESSGEPGSDAERSPDAG
jgi:NTP pyrophosphatase (non-canonical NTP hydrolase)